MDHDAAVRQDFALIAGDEQQRSHACRHVKANGADGAAHGLHDVVKRQAGLDFAARAVDIKRDRHRGILALEVKQAADDDGARFCIHRGHKLELALVKHLVADVEAIEAFCGFADDLRLIDECIFAHDELLPRARRDNLGRNREGANRQQASMSCHAQGVAYKVEWENPMHGSCIGNSYRRKAYLPGGGSRDPRVLKTVAHVKAARKWGNGKVSGRRPCLVRLRGGFLGKKLGGTAFATPPYKTNRFFYL